MRPLQVQGPLALWAFPARFEGSLAEQGITMACIDPVYFLLRAIFGLDEGGALSSPHLDCAASGAGLCLGSISALKLGQALPVKADEFVVQALENVRLMLYVVYAVVGGLLQVFDLFNYYLEVYLHFFVVIFE